MNTNQTITTSKSRLAASTLKALGYTALLTVSLTLGSHYAQATSLQSNKVYGFVQGQAQNEYDQIDAALAPIALYPDSLLTHILIASTYPLEVIEAARFIQQHPKFDVEDYKTNGLDQSTIESIQEDALEYAWDASVVALTAFPDILNNMSDDLSWLSDLGDAFENDQELVLSRVQRLRELAYDQGNLQNDDQVEVVVEQEQETRVIVIQPRRHEVVYVPYYDSAVIYGPNWHITSSYRWSRPYYARHYRHNYVYFSPGAYIGSRLLFGGIHWSNRHISIHRDWSYRKARHYNYRNTQYKRVHNREYQRWTPVKRHTRHVERQKYVGKNATNNSYKRNKWVTNKHSEFAKVRSSDRTIVRSDVASTRQLSKTRGDAGQGDRLQIDRSQKSNVQNAKLYKSTDKTVIRQPKPIKKTQVERRDRVLQSTKPAKTVISKQQRDFSQPNASKPQRDVVKPLRQVSKPQRQVSKPQRQVSKPQRQVSKPQRQAVQRTKQVKRSKE